MSIERRQSPRVLATRPVRARALGTSYDFTVIDVSAGGLCAQCTEPPLLHHDYVLDIFVPTGRVARLDARALYCRLIENTAGTLFEVGFAFRSIGEPDTQAAIDALLKAVTAVLEIEAGRPSSSSGPLEDGVETPALGIERRPPHLDVH